MLLGQSRLPRIYFGLGVFVNTAAMHVLGRNGGVADVGTYRRRRLGSHTLRSYA